MSEVIISRDKKNPTWAWVGGTVDDVKEKRYKRIIVDVLQKGIMHVTEFHPEPYMKGERYNISFSPYYEIIKEPEYRPFKDGDEFIKFLKDTGRIDMRIINKHNGSLRTINDIFNDECYIAGDSRFSFRGFCLDFIWFDTEEPIGVKE